MTSYELWLFLHIAAAIVWIGGAVVAQVFGVLAKRSADLQRAAAFGRDMALIGPRVFMPAAIVVLVTGVLVTEDGNWDWSEPFVYLGVILGVGVALVAFLYLTRAMGAAGAQMAQEGPESPALVARVDRLVLVARLLILVLFVIVFLMVVKPGT